MVQTAVFLAINCTSTDKILKLSTHRKLLIITKALALVTVSLLFFTKKMYLMIDLLWRCC